MLKKEGETETNIPQKASAVSVNTQVPKKGPASNIQRKSSKCDICSETVYSNQKTCHNCGAVNRSYNPALDTGNYDLFRTNTKKNTYQNITFRESDYDYFKQVSTIVMNSILGVIFLILLISGMFSCSGPGEVSGTVKSWGIWIIIVISVVIIRWIVLIVYKISHK